jgi:hypothetical protein
MVAAVEFTVPEMAEIPGDDSVPFSDAINDDTGIPPVDAISQAAD